MNLRKCTCLGYIWIPCVHSTAIYRHPHATMYTIYKRAHRKSNIET